MPRLIHTEVSDGSVQRHEGQKQSKRNGLAKSAQPDKTHLVDRVAPVEPLGCHVHQAHRYRIGTHMQAPELP